MNQAKTKALNHVLSAGASLTLGLRDPSNAQSWRWQPQILTAVALRIFRPVRPACIGFHFTCEVGFGGSRKVSRERTIFCAGGHP